MWWSLGRTPCITIGTELGDDSFICDNHRDHRGKNAFVDALEFSADCGRGSLPTNGSGNIVVSTRLRPNEGNRCLIAEQRVVGL